MKTFLVAALLLPMLALGQDKDPTWQERMRPAQEWVSQYMNVPQDTKPVLPPKLLERFTFHKVGRPRLQPGQALSMDVYEFTYHSELALVGVGYDVKRQLEKEKWVKESSPDFETSFRLDHPSGPVEWQRVQVKFDLMAYAIDGKTQRTLVVYTEKRRQ